MKDHRWAFRVRGEATESLELDIYDDIGPWFSVDGVATSKHVRSLLREQRQAKAIAVRINSGGGDVTDGIAIYNLLREHPAKVTVQVDGLAASIASVVAMAADEIVMAESAFMMIHNPWGLTVGDANDMRAHADLLDKMRDVIVDVYVARTGQTRDDVVAALEAETWMTAAEAVELGYADRVVEMKAKPEKRRAAARAWNLADFSRVPEAVRALQERHAQGGQTEMNLKEINAALGLPEDASEETAREALAKAAKAVNSGGGVDAALLELTGKPTSAAALGTVAAWKTQVEAAQQREAERAAKAKVDEVAARAQRITTSIDTAIEEGRLPPAKKAAVLAMGEKFGPEAVEAHLEQLDTPLVDMRPPPGKQPAMRAAASDHADPETLAACRAAGLTLEEFREWGPKTDAYFAKQERGDQ